LMQNGPAYEYTTFRGGTTGPGTVIGGSRFGDDDTFNYTPDRQIRISVLANGSLLHIVSQLFGTPEPGATVCGFWRNARAAGHSRRMV
jgi:hypothetical protein